MKGISDDECQALRHLDAAEYDIGRLTDFFGHSESILRRHIDGFCRCEEKSTDTDERSFSDELKEVRLDRGLTQSEAAKLLGVNTSTISAWENDYRLPSKLSESAVLETIKHE